MKKIAFILLALVSISINAQTLEQAKLEFQKDNFSIAKEQLLTIYKTNKASIIALYLGNCYSKLEELDSARIYFQNAEACTDAYAFIAKARINVLDKKDVVTMTTNIDKAISLSKKKDAEVFFQAGYLAFNPKTSNPDIFIFYFEEACRLAPTNAFYKLTFGDLFLIKKDKGTAMDKYEEVIVSNPNSVLAHIRKGRLFYTTGSAFSQAIESYNTANSIDSNYAIVHKDLGEIYSLIKDNKKSAMAYKKYVSVNPNDARAKIIYCNKLYQIKEYQTIVDAVNGYVKSDPTNMYYHRLLAYSNYELKNNAEAAKNLNALFSNGAKDRITGLDYSYAAKINLANNDTIQTIESYKSALKIDSTNAEIQTDYAKLLYSAKRYPEAIFEYNKRIKMKTVASSVDYFNLGRAYYYNKDYVNADSMFAKYTRLNPESPDGYLWRAKCNQTKEGTVYKGFASSYYEKYITLAANTPEDVTKNKSNLATANTYLGYVSKDAKDKVKAKAYFTKVLEYEPTNTFAISALAAIAKMK